MSRIAYIDLSPLESYQQARRDVEQGLEEAWDALDRHLRWHFMNHIQNRAENLDNLDEALLEAAHWAIREEREPWRTRWSYLLELMTDAEWQPSLAISLRAVEGRAAEMLVLLVQDTQPLRPSDVSKALGISPQQFSNVGQRLEAAGLIVRRKTGGRFTWMFPTVEGRELAGLLPGVSQASSAPASAEPAEEDEDGAAAPWDGPSLAQDVPEAA
jgi:DNA-binding MarR family transcriptional regulator